MIGLTVSSSRLWYIIQGLRDELYSMKTFSYSICLHALDANNAYIRPYTHLNKAVVEVHPEYRGSVEWIRAHGTRHLPPDDVQRHRARLGVIVQCQIRSVLLSMRNHDEQRTHTPHGKECKNGVEGRTAHGGCVCISCCTCLCACVYACACACAFAMMEGKSYK